MDCSSDSHHDHYSSARPSSPMEDIMKLEDTNTTSALPPMPMPAPASGPKHRLKGSKSNGMLRSSTAPHPLSMSGSNSSNSSLHHFQSSNSYSSPSSGFNSNNSYSQSAVGPLSAPSSPTFPNSTVPSNSGTSSSSSFMAMNGHNTSLYEPFRRNSVPILSVDQAEHKRKVSEEKYMQRQGSWSSSSNSSMMGPPPGLHQLEAAHLDPATMHYYRTQFSQQQNMMQQQMHMGLNQVMPTSNASSPMSESFGINGSSGHHSSVGAIRSSKVKRNNSICSTTSISSTGSGSNNKHPCKFASCEWSFKRFEHLKRHMLVHTKERPFQCDFAGCNKSFSRSDNFSAHLRTHSKKALAHRRYDSRANDNNNGNSVKQEASYSLTLPSQDTPGGMAGFVPHPSLHLSNSYSTGSLNDASSEYGRDYSPPISPGGTPIARSSSAMGGSSLHDDDQFDMMGHSSYSFGSNSMYSLDHLDHLNNMVPRFDTIRLDLKSVAPSDIHKHYDDENSDGLLPGSNPNGESPRSSPMPQYEHFSFPSSISTHFMPIVPSGFQGESPLGHHHGSGGHHSHQMSMQHMSHDSLSSSSYSSLQSGDSFSSSPSFHHGYSDDLRFPHGSGGAAALPPHPLMSSLSSSSAHEMADPVLSHRSK
ncbi:hypothetical protein BGZ74_000536 [Mortierella antarctica]|nr:hypothetical protein BGZ74_000536 [Mortierella antarctica]